MIVNLFALRSEKESKHDEMTLFSDSPQCLDLSLIIWFSIDLCCRLLIRLMLLTHLAYSYNPFKRFLIHFVVCWYMLLTNPCRLRIYVAWNSWNVIHGMCLVITKTLLPAGFCFCFFFNPSFYFFKRSGIFKYWNYSGDS